MSLVAEYLFWISFYVLIYTYAGYPLLLLAIVAIKKKLKRVSVLPDGDQKAVTLVIAAYNEEDIIRKKIINTLELDYPTHLLKIMIVTDGSTDNTATIVKEYAQIRLLHENARKGKLAAINRAMTNVDTELVVFSDANGFLNKECIRWLVAHFSDAKTGAVTGEKKIIKESTQVGEGEGLYWQYESLLKRLDSGLHTVVGAAGELLAMRTALYERLHDNVIIEDFVQSLKVCEKGYVVKYEPRAFSAETPSVDIRDEMERKIRIAAGGFQAMVILKSLFNVFRHPVLTFQFISHRILRWTLCPLALAIILPAAVAAYLGERNVFYGVSAFALAVLWGCGVIGWVFARRNVRHRLFYLPFYFLFMHVCVFGGFARFVGGRQGAVWRKAART